MLALWLGDRLRIVGNAQPLLLLLLLFCTAVLCCFCAVLRDCDPAALQLTNAMLRD